MVGRSDIANIPVAHDWAREVYTSTLPLVQLNKVNAKVKAWLTLMPSKHNATNVTRLTCGLNYFYFFYYVFAIYNFFFFVLFQWWILLLLQSFPRMEQLKKLTKSHPRHKQPQILVTSGQCKMSVSKVKAVSLAVLFPLLLLPLPRLPPQ